MTLTFAKKTLFLLTGLAAAGCSDFFPTPLKPVATEPDLVGIRLAQAAEKASSSLDAIAGIEQQRAPLMPKNDDLSSAPAALQQPITITWSGPVEQILETLATRSGMKFKVKGNRPGVPLVVNLNVFQKAMIEVLQDVGLQVGRRADVTVNSTSSVIEIRYAPVDRT